MLAPHQIYMTERDSGEMLYNSTETIIQWRLHCALVYCNISFKIMNLHESIPPLIPDCLVKLLCCIIYYRDGQALDPLYLYILKFTYACDVFDTPG